MKKNQNNCWVLTDDMSSQHLKQITIDKFDCIEVRAMPDGTYGVVRTILDLDEIPRMKLESIIESYYQSVDEVFSEYGEAGAAQIMAECIFEQLPVEEMDESILSLCEMEALDMVQKMIGS